MTALFAGLRKDRTWLLGLMGLSGANCGTNAAVSQRFTAIVYKMGANWGNRGKAFLVPVSTIRGLRAFLVCAVGINYADNGYHGNKPEHHQCSHFYSPSFLSLTSSKRWRRSSVKAPRPPCGCFQARWQVCCCAAPSACCNRSASLSKCLRICPLPPRFSMPYR